MIGWVTEVRRGCFVLLLLGFLFGIAQGASALRVLDWALCRGLDKDGLPLDRIDKFSTEDQAVVFWVFLEGAQKGDECHFVFVPPSGTPFESFLILEDVGEYIGVKGELPLAGRSLPAGRWTARLFIRGEQLLEASFTLVESSIVASASQDEAVRRTASLLAEFGYTVFDVGFLAEENQAYIRMEMATRSLDQALWNQIGVGFDSLKRLFPGAAWLVVQLLMDKEYVLSFQVKTYDFDIWRRGYLSSDEFWKKRVLRYVYNIRKREEVKDVKGFYAEKFGVVF
ncbi:MAG: hypothetical protein N2205_00425 [Candidatus Caldatribacterium sp.]|uniref:hypothetical protein n=1 Tax=Candidatus Caldatribacterium sp. TaxID=2282143 RepID=UPI0029942D2D|nr:hypothetical protein [Candidatus Caldatribacterium sp.]MCX7729667.1 hypothetical protein [Candidatus Caldatribacterium sp.]MDW8081685.1 hypothetical protein [Candidatus Calescibacterium sp.]